MREALVIIGSHDKTRDDFDWSREDCDVWLMNEACAPDGWAASHAHRVDAILQMHAPAIWRNVSNHTNPQNAAWLMSGDTPLVYMQRQEYDVPRSIKYPLDEICEALLGEKFTPRYFTSSVAYCMALGVYLGYPSIELYGVELENDTEYRYQREAFAFWTGLAIGHGVKITAYSRMFDAPLYGYEGDVSLPIDEITRRLEEITPERDKRAEKYTALSAEFERQYATLADHPSDDGEATHATLRELAVAAYEFGHIDGGKQESERYLAKAQEMHETYGESIILRGEFEHSAAINLKTAQDNKSKLDAVAGALGVAWGQAVKEKPAQRRKRLKNEVATLANQYLVLSVWSGVYAGAYAEGVHYMLKLDALIKAAGGEKSERVLLEKIGVPV